MPYLAPDTLSYVCPHTGKLSWVVIPRPSNFHAHLRQNELLDAVAHATMLPWKYLLAMPNTGPITTIEKMLAYRERLLETRDTYGLSTEFIMTIYLTASLKPEDIERMAELSVHCAVKYYPPVTGATTGSGLGIPLVEAGDVLRAMEVHGVRLLGHFESVYDKHGILLPQEVREDYFMEHEFARLRDKYPDLKITIEHATTAQAINRVEEDNSGNTVCTITPQAMILERNDLDTLSWAVHAKCMPIAKTPLDRKVVTDFATSGDFRAFLGDDTAPHPSNAKERLFQDAASGCFVPHSLALYLRVFFENEALENFARFACFNGPHWWGLPTPDDSDRILLVRDDETDIPSPFRIPGSTDVVIPFGWTKQDDAYHPGMKLFSNPK